MKRATSIVAVLALAAVVSSPALAGDLVVIANPSVTIDSMPGKELRRIFFKQTTRWPDGSTAKPIDQSMTSDVRRVFSREVLQRNLASVESFWNGQVFSGRGTPPPTAQSDAEVLAYVRGTPGAVGYVSSSASTSGVRVITITD
jgi:ABC-type phosphate transport system substrate-binding protein